MRRLLGVLRERRGRRASSRRSRGWRSSAQLVERARAAGVPVDAGGRRASRGALPAGVDLSAYRIVQEALTNVRKHARGAPTRSCGVGWRDGRARAARARRGQGPARPATGGGHGLIGMRERVRLHGGELRRRPAAAAAASQVAARCCRRDRASLLADDQELVRAGFRLILELAGLEVVGEAGDGARGGRAGARAATRRRADGRADAAHGRHRGDAPDRPGRPAHARARAHHVRPRRVRLRRAAGRRERLPAQGRRAASGSSTPCARSRPARRCVAPTVLRRLVEHYVARPAARAPGRPDGAATSSPSASSRC